MFDVSYAAAWELGRLLSLRDKSFSVALYHWKRAHKQQLHALEQAVVHPDLPIGSGAASVEVPAAVAAGFDRLRRLEGVPFNYLVPDERMLPKESIRFFKLDPSWVDCLLDGAFSIGRVTSGDHTHDREHTAHAAANPHRELSGFLLRSDLVAGWPGLLADGFPVLPEDLGLELLRYDRLSPNVLLCLFAGNLTTLDLHLKPETLHFGLAPPDTTHAGYFKELRDGHGAETLLEVDTVNVNGQGRVDITGLAEAMQSILVGSPLPGADAFADFTAAQFGLQMIEGSVRMRFLREV